jgi:hypothetical protein
MPDFRQRIGNLRLANDLSLLASIPRLSPQNAVILMRAYGHPSALWRDIVETARAVG